MPKMLRRFQSDAVVRGRDINRLMDTVLGNEGGRFKLWGDDGDELDLITGQVISSNNYPMDISSAAGTHERVRHSADTHDVWKVLDAGITVQGTAGITGNTTLTGTLAVSGNTTVGGTLGVTGLGTFNAGLTVAAGVLTVPAGSAGAPSVAVGEATTGLFRPSGGQLAVTLSGTERARLTSTGLGIGATAPVRALHVVKGGGTAQSIGAGSNSDDAIVVDGDPTAAINLVGASGGFGVLKFSTPGTHQRAVIWWDDANERLDMQVGSSRVRVEASGITLIGDFAAFGGTPAAQPTVAADATDPASTQTLVNSLKDALLDLNLVTT